MKIKIEIKHYLTGAVLFEFRKENNTLKDTLIEGVKRCADLGGADLRCADLLGADLRDADLGGAYLRDADLGVADLGGAYLRDADLGGADLRGADLRDAYLGDADLGGADLGGADLRGADLRCADLGGADLRDAYLGGAYLRDADLGGAYLGGADLGGADLLGADLRDADLGGAYLRDAYLGGAYLGGAKNVPLIPFSCPSDGSFIGWKKINNYKESYTGSYLVKLEIPEDARRCSSTSYKCRCDKARVLAITRIKDGKNVDIITNISYGECVYKVGEMVIPDGFDEDRWNECSSGIHFFINKQQAIDY